MKLSIAICDDENEQLQYLTGLLGTWDDRNKHLMELKTFSSAEAFLFEYGENKAYDILLLDVEMGKMSGVDLAKEIRKENHTIQFIFITGFYEYFSDGYDVSALHYLIKPATSDRLYPVLDRAVQNLNYRERSILIDTGEEQIKVPLSDIIYIEADKVHINIVTTQGKYRTRTTLLKISELLDDTFFKVHRSYIVGLKYVRKITRQDITVANGDNIPISRGMYDSVHAALIKNL